MTSQHLVVVTGYRHYAYPTIVRMTLDTLYVKHGPFILFHGACRDKLTGEMVGADQYADDWGQRCPDVEVVPFEADWHEHGDPAGPIRNRLMVETAVRRVPVANIHGLAFPGPGSRGTWNCVKVMRDHGIEPDVWGYARVRSWLSTR